VGISMSGVSAIRVVVRKGNLDIGQHFSLPSWVRKMLGWRTDELLIFRTTSEGNILVERAPGRTSRMTKSRIHIPAEIARSLNLRDGDVLELEIQGDRLLIKRAK